MTHQAGLRGVAVLAAVLAISSSLVAGCSGDDPDGPADPGPAEPFVLGDAMPLTEPANLRSPALAGVSEASYLVTGRATGPSDEALVVLDRANGEERWRVRGQDDRVAEGVDGYRHVTFAEVGPAEGSPVVMPYTDYTCTTPPTGCDESRDDARRDDGVVALDQATGEQLWRVSTGTFSSTSQVVAVTADLVVVDNARAAEVSAFDAATGEPVWVTEGSNPTVTDGHVLLVRDGVATVIALDSAAEEWRGTTDQYVVGTIRDALLVVEGKASDGLVVPLDGDDPYPAEGFVVRQQGDLLVWFDEDLEHLSTLAAGEDEPTTVEIDDRFDLLSFRAALDGRLFFDREGEVTVLDRQAREVGTFDGSSSTIASHYVLVKPRGGQGLPALRAW